MKTASKKAKVAATVLMSPQDIQRCLNRLAHEIIENNPGLTELALVGIHTRGVVLARRLLQKLQALENTRVPLGTLDITMNRDDLHMKLKQPLVRRTEINFDITGKDILLIDDILYTGRSVQAALEALKEFGRPRRVMLLVFVDRGHRELPIRADYVGKEIKTSKNQVLKLHLKETDKEDQLVLL